MFKVSKGLSPEIVNKLFQSRKQIPYQLRKTSQFQTPLVHSVFSGTKNLKFVVPKIWAMVPNEMKQLESLWKFRNTTKRPCRLCKRYIYRIGFL